MLEAGLRAHTGAAARCLTWRRSFFDPLPTGADAYLLSDILHDWDDDHARRILDGCRRAATPGATVVVVEPVRDQGADTTIDLFMLMCFGGRERTVEELTALADGSGLTLRAASPVADGRTALELVPSDGDAR
ncbi:methyltransferase [Amycolatopsis solani]|uniref:methyltransferase n=1 Tax=Amycolatopsis solani TaxID=3028615 RepID=UPI0025B04944|nr:methyltransferase [Amycolatopsis sp. MEP2-6]